MDRVAIQILGLTRFLVHVGSTTLGSSPMMVPQSLGCVVVIGQGVVQGCHKGKSREWWARVVYAGGAWGVVVGQ
eukprot:2023071-Heterocapsa_arctica.AAC.1